MPSILKWSVKRGAACCGSLQSQSPVYPALFLLLLFLSPSLVYFTFSGDWYWWLFFVCFCYCWFDVCYLWRFRVFCFGIFLCFDLFYVSSSRAGLCVGTHRRRRLKKYGRTPRLSPRGRSSIEKRRGVRGVGPLPLGSPLFWLVISSAILSGLTCILVRWRVFLTLLSAPESRLIIYTVLIATLNKPTLHSSWIVRIWTALRGLCVEVLPILHKTCAFLAVVY